jgi:hypothetical protein
MSIRRSFLALSLAIGAVPATAPAADVGVSGLKLIIVDKLASSGSAKVVFVSKDAGVAKGAEGDPGEVDANVAVYYTDRRDVNAGFVMSSGAGWLVNKDTVAKYVNKAAPTGGGVKVAVVKPGKLAKVVTKSLGEPGHAIDMVAAGPPSDEAGVTVILTVRNRNDGSTTRMCSRFSLADGSSVAFKTVYGTGRKLVAKNGVSCSPTPDCDPLNAAECLLPYPSTQFLLPDATTATGWRMNLPAAGLPAVNGTPLDPAMWNELDGFSPTTQIMMHFPDGVDLALTDAARLLAPACCGQPAGPPWVDTRTYTDRSLDADSPSVLIDADTNERILHWLEVDGRATGGNDPSRKTLFLRPAKSLTPGHRYIVAVRDLRTPADTDVAPEAAFAALRDGTPSGDPAVELRRPYFESSVFPVLAGNGITRPELLLAFDFVVQSDDQLTRQIVSMRDQAFAWIDTVEADTGVVPFTVSSTVDNDCNVPGTVIWRRVSGTFQSPLFLTAVPTQNTTPVQSVDPETDLPVQNGFMNAPFDVQIPCSVFDGGVTSRPLVMGHGIFGTGASAVQDVIDTKSPWGPFTYIAGGTDWIGLSDNRDVASDIGWIGSFVIGLGTSQLNHFPAFVDRLRQGTLNTLVLAKLMKLGIFNRHAAFETSPGVGVFPGPSEEMYYAGSSLGGIYGTYFSGLTPDVERFNVDVPAIAFSCLLQRSTQFVSFDLVIQSIGITDPMKFALLIDLLHEVWVSAEPAALATHITTSPLPGSGNPKKLLMTVAWLDKQVSNQCTEAAARTLGLPNLDGSLQAGLQDIPDVVGPVDSATITYSTGAFDLFDPDHQPHIPPLSNLFPTNVCDPHGGPRRTPAMVQQFYAFLQPGGQVSNFCNGLCDAAEPLEIPGGGTCDGSSGILAGTKCTSDAECGAGLCEATVCDPAP